MLQVFLCIAALQRQLIQLFEQFVDLMRWVLLKPLDCFIKGFAIKRVPMPLELDDDNLLVLTLHGAN